LLRGLDCRVNLIRYHTIPGVSLKSSSERTMMIFRDSLNARGITATIRASRGEDILAACGMLSSQKNNQL
ncbi:MAG: 23S rRNA (adenine(2503)-C(2))-methyltransferase RlmN, partial [Bacteroidales bacterium]